MHARSQILLLGIQIKWARPRAHIALLGIQFQWTADTQDALSKAKADKTIMSKNMKKVDNVLKEMVSCVGSNSEDSLHLDMDQQECSMHVNSIRVGSIPDH
eukprot:1158208-Pelagomonas_calceolata.AAC.30